MSFTIDDNWHATLDGVQLPYLSLQPESDGYGVVEGNTNVAVQLDGGAPRIRADQQGAAKTLTVQWTLNPSQFDFLMAFYRKAINNGSDPFYMQLVGIDNAELTPYQVQIIPASFTPIKSQSGLAYIVGARLYVLPNSDNAVNDQTTLDDGVTA
jgi:hypothetical protein